MRQCADRYHVDPAFGYCADGFEINAARSFRQAAPRNAAHSLAQLCRRHVVEEYGVDIERQHLVQLLECVDLDFDFDQMPDVRARRLNGVLQPAGRDDVIVFDQDGIE